MKRGDHIKANRLVYTHHGVYIGDGWVIHYAGEGWAQLDDVKTPRVQRDRLSTFRGDSKATVVQHPNPAPPDTVVKRAKSRLGEEDYDLIWNNCEHFATACVTGVGWSNQVAEAAKDGGLGWVALLLAGPIGWAAAGGAFIAKGGVGKKK